jgi:hypothetical protein
VFTLAKQSEIPPFAKDFVLPASRYDAVKADYAAAFIGVLRHTKG